MTTGIERMADGFVLFLSLYRRLAPFRSLVLGNVVKYLLRTHTISAAELKGTHTLVTHLDFHAAQGLHPAPVGVSSTQML
jgi:hypothetical protein